MSPQGPAEVVSEFEVPNAIKPDSGMFALALVAAFHKKACEPDQLRHELGLGADKSTPEHIARGAKILGLKARIIRNQAVARLPKIPLPAVLELKDGSFVLLGRVEAGTFRLVDAVKRSATICSEAELRDRWAGTVILIATRFQIDDLGKSFGLGWFIPPIWRYRRPLTNVLIASLFIQLCALITPIFFQITIDKVLVHKGYSTLALVGVGMIAVAGFQVVLQHLKTYILSHTTSRIDVELGAKLFDHLTRLPLGYFETRAAGQTVARVRELETIRNFLTGQGLSAAIDVPFTIIFLAVLFLYSTKLALIVTLSIPLYVLVAYFIRPILRDRMIERFNRSALSNQFLIEAVVGIQTIKSLAVEPTLKNQWEDRLAGYVKTSFATVVLASVGQNAIQFLNKLTTALVLFFGAYAVMEGDLTVGSLVAFNMIMGQVMQPILRISQLWQDFQQVNVSVDRLGDVLNQPQEPRSAAHAALPPAAGNIVVKDVTFRYYPKSPDVLSEVSLAIPAGQVVGIVGPSGSGKSTFTKLLQRLYSPERGQIFLDGNDIALVDPAWLRRQIGVVLQENLLFNRTIHENIALANPGMPRASVMAVAKLAGADEFINKLPLGYDTPIEERGSNLSGGQRQRLAIARALAINPRILIFDEATSALDYESERIIQENMKQIVRGRTVIIIAHRLAAVRTCDRIIAIENGKIIEDGTHSELLMQPKSMYGRLWRIQSDGGATV